MQEFRPEFVEDVAMNLDGHAGSWFDRYVRTVAGTIAGGTPEIQRSIIAQRLPDPPRN